MTHATDLASSPAVRAARQYRQDARRLRRLAVWDYADDPDEQKRLRYLADMADHAALNEGRPR